MYYSLQAPLSMSFSRQEDWSVLPWAPPGALSSPEMEPVSLLSALAGQLFTTTHLGSPCEPPWGSLFSFGSPTLLRLFPIPVVLLFQERCVNGRRQRVTP